MTLAAAQAGCGQLSTGEGQHESASLTSDNGLRMVNGLKGRNGFDPTCGINTGGTGGLSSTAGLSSSGSLMTTVDGRTTVQYLVRCALPVGHNLVKADQNGVNYTFAGSLGLAPEWETGTCGQNCQMWVSACLLSMINTTGMHYPIWIDGQAASVGWGTDPSYPYQEGSFFGNLFSTQTTAPAYYCEGRDFGVKPIPGRIGSAQTSPPYTDIYGVGNKCTTYCTPADYPHAAEGSKACSGWNQILTVYHQ